MGRAIGYLVIGVGAVRVGLGGDASSSRAGRSGNADLLSVPGGSVVLALIGAVVLVSGAAGCSPRSAPSRPGSTTSAPVAISARIE